jgi:hypothetical protein
MVSGNECNRVYYSIQAIYIFNMGDNHGYDQFQVINRITSRNRIYLAGKSKLFRLLSAINIYYFRRNEWLRCSNKSEYNKCHHYFSHSDMDGFI